MNVDINELPYILDEEVDIYGLENDLDDKTIEEIRFIVSSFAKHFKKSYKKDGQTLKILKEFEISLDLLKDGVFGTQLATNAIYLYKNLPTIKNIYEESLNELQDEIKNLKNKNESLEKECASLTKKLKDFDECKRELKELAECKKELEKLAKTLRDETSKKSSVSSKSNWDSYGSCGGSIGRSSYGSC